MTDSLSDLLATDAQLDLVGARDLHEGSDAILDTLARLAGAIDERALPPLPEIPCQPPTRTARKGNWALSVTVALMITSSGVAAAVSDDPLAPLHYVTSQLWDLGSPDHGELQGWELDGSLPVSTVPDALVPGSIGVSQADVSSRTATSGRGHRASRSAAGRSSEPRSGNAATSAVGGSDIGGRGGDGYGHVGNGYGHRGVGSGGQQMPDRRTGHGHYPGSPPGSGHGDVPGSSGGRSTLDPGSPPRPLDPSMPDRPGLPGHESRDPSTPRGMWRVLVAAAPPAASPAPPAVPAPPVPAEAPPVPAEAPPAPADAAPAPADAPPSAAAPSIP